MDKETLSNYGWIVICVLVLAVMIALATPFGSFIAGAVENTTEGLFGASQKAMNQTGLLNIADQEMEHGATVGGEEKREVIPTGGIYVSNLVSDSGCEICDPDFGNWCHCNAVVLKEGDFFPKETKVHDLYIYGDYAYMYQTANHYQAGQACPYVIDIPNTCHIQGFQAIYNDYDKATVGWQVGLNTNIADIGKKEKFGEILSYINNKPVTELASTFHSCGNLKEAPTIPETITNMERAFERCNSLTTMPEIPNRVKNMENAFAGTGLKSTIPIPENVDNIRMLFAGCTNLTGNVVINANPTFYDNCFFLTELEITITGSSTKLNEIAATSEGNVKVEK